MKRLSYFPKLHHLPYKNHTFHFSLPLTRKSTTCLHLGPPTTTTTATTICRKNKKIIVIMGATGAGKSRLSIDLATKFFPDSEIINSDKIQVYKGLDITTNKIPLHERNNVPHHLLGEFDPSESHPEFSRSDFRSVAGATISKIFSRRKIPIIVGGSNSFLYALLATRFNPELDMFSASNSDNSFFCKQLRYSCCFIWVDVSFPVLTQYLMKRVEDMLDSGMYEELAEYFRNPESDSVSHSGLRKAIGIPEFEGYFKKRFQNIDEDNVAYEEAVWAIKENTCQLAKRQIEKIIKLRDAAGWELKRVDATAAFTAAMGGQKVADVWEKQVLQPSVKIVNKFFME